MNRNLFSLFLMGVLFFNIPTARAESEASCAIWLCLPGGFPTGCVEAYSEFKNRIKHGKPPLPSLSSCMTGPSGNSSNGKYEIGIEYFMPCKEGFAIEGNISNSNRGMCKPTSSLCNLSPKYRGGKKVDCTPYEAIRRVNPRYVKMWVDGKYLGQFFYQ